MSAIFHNTIGEGRAQSLVRFAFNDPETRCWNLQSAPDGDCTNSLAAMT